MSGVAAVTGALSLDLAPVRRSRPEPWRDVVSPGSPRPSARTERKPTGLPPSRVVAMPAGPGPVGAPADGGAVLRRSRCGCAGSGSCACHSASHPAHPSTVATSAPAAAAGVLARHGEPLPAGVRSRFEAAFGTDLSDVRLHADPLASAVSDQLDADAWTSGSHVALAEGRWAPGTQASDRLLAHEITHVLQHRAPGSPGVREAAAEAEADRAAGQFAAGERIAWPQARAPAVARQSRAASSVVTRVDVNCADMTIHFNGPRAHTWRLTECDLSDGDYEATIGQAVRTTTFVLNLRNAPEGTRFRFSYAITATDPDPLHLVRIGQQVKVHATSTPGARSAGGPGAAGGSDVHVSVHRLSVAEFTAMTGLSPMVLPENQIVSAESLAAGTQQRKPVGPWQAGLGPAGVGAWSATPTPMSFVPPNSTFLLWTEGHMSLGANVNGSLVVRGYRGNLAWYLGEMTPGIGSWFTRRLITGIPGGWQNDFLFPRLPGFRYPQTVIYLPTSATGALAFADELKSFEAGGEYRYSPPRPPGTEGARPTETALFEELYGTGQPVIVRCTNNCITVPIRLAEKAIGARPSVTVGGERLDVATGTYQPSGRVDPLEAGRAARMREFLAAPEGLPPGAMRITLTPGAMRGMAYIRVGGTIALVYGVYHTAEHLEATWGTPEFPAAVGEEAGGWAGGLLGSALGGAIGGAIACAPAGPIDAVCVVGGFLGGLLFGAVFGTAGAAAGRSLVETLQRINPAQLNEAAVWMFGSDEDRRRYYELQEIMESF